MGGGIAMACANAGITVVLTDTEQAGLDRAMATIRKNYDSSVKKGRFTPEAAAERLGRITTQVGHGRLRPGRRDHRSRVREHGAQEGRAGAARRRGASRRAAGDQHLDARHRRARRRDDAAAGGDRHRTSSARPTSCGWSRSCAARTTTPETIAAAQALAKRLGKVGVVVGNCPGFVGNRMMFPYMYEAQFLAEDGATPAQVDKALTDWGMAMGIFAVDDMGGLDVAWRVRQELEPVQRSVAAQTARRRPARGDEPPRTEDRLRLVHLRREPPRHARSRGGGAHRAHGHRRRHQRAAASPAKRSSSARSTRSSTRGRRSSRKATRCAPPTSTSST